VTTSVIALIPPSQGIRAILATVGTSRVVIGGDSFRTVVLQRGPEQVALSSPANATGLLALDRSYPAGSDPQAEMLAPFEGIGVDTTWELQIPMAANPFDYSTIADVLISIDYTALDSPDYRQQVIRQLDSTTSADRGYSFRYQFADQWYELNNPQQSATPMVVIFTTERNDFPPNLTDGPTIKQIVLYFAPSSGRSFEIHSVSLQCGTGLKGTADTENDVISTRRGNGGAWDPMLHQAANQQWTLDLSGATERQSGLTAAELFTQGCIADIVFVITWEGTLPSWPT
jgi:hypothetical protein